MINKILTALWAFIKLIFKFILYIIKSIKFIFRIPLTSLIATIFSIGAVFAYRLVFILVELIVESFFKSDFSVNYPLIDTLIGAIIFIVINCAFFNDQLKNDPKFHPHRSLFYFAPTIIMWIIPILIFQDIADDAIYYLANNLQPFELVYTIFFIGFYGPHMWMAFLTKSVIGIAIGLAINNLIYLLRSYFILENPFSRSKES